MTRRIAVVNAGAATLKLALLDVDQGVAREIQRIECRWMPGEQTDAVIRAALDRLDHVPDAFGHRIVHGGAHFVEPVVVSAELERELDSLAQLAPLHNAPALRAVRVVRERFPLLPAVCVFDTAFHAHRPEVSMRYALPEALVERFAIRRYGFHGLAHASLVAALARAQDSRRDQVAAVTLQLGGGCSACAVRAGRSLETSMGYTPLEGLVMATRSGDVDPAIVLRLVRAGFSADEIEDWLTRHSGLEALCGTSDMRELLEAQSRGDGKADFAIELFCRRIVMIVGAYLTLLDGEGALVFGGGIGANAPAIRARVCAGLRTWGIDLDEARNFSNTQGLISTASSRPVYALKTDEETEIAVAVDDRLASVRN